MKSVVVYNVFGHKNNGDAMLIEALLDLIHEAAPSATVEGIAFDVESQEKWLPGVRWHERVGNKVSRDPKGKALQTLHFGLSQLLARDEGHYPVRHAFPKRQREALEALRNADLAISCPGGYIEDSSISFYVALMQMRLASRLARKNILAPQSIGPVKSERGRRAIAKTLSDIDQIYVREPYSLEFVGQIVPAMRDKVTLAGDLAFWHRADDVITMDELKRQLGIGDKPILGLTMVDWNFPHGANLSADRERYISAMAQLIQHAAGKGFTAVVFNQVAYDMPITMELHRRCPNVIIDVHERSAGALSRLIGTSEVFMGTRFHSCIFSLLNARPTGAIAYLPKTTGIMDELKLQEFVLDINTVTGDSLIAMFEKLIAGKHAISGRIRESVSRYRTERSNFVNDLREMLN